MAVRVQLGRLARVDLRLRPVGAVRESRRRRARDRLIPYRDQPGRAVWILEIGMGQVDPGIHVPDQNALSGLSGEIRRRYGANRWKPQVHRALVEVELAPLGDLEAPDAGRGHELIDLPERTTRRQESSRYRVHLDALRAEQFRRDIALDEEIDHLRAVSGGGQGPLIDLERRVDRRAQREGNRAGRRCDGDRAGRGHEEAKRE